MLSISASMLYDYTKCPHRVFLDCFGDRKKQDEVHPFAELLWERGHAFEEQTITTLDVPFLNLRHLPLDQREELTLRGMREGQSLIYGGRISCDRLLGEPDLLRRTATGYQPGDIKSGAGVEGVRDDSDGKPKMHYAVQLALYLDILQREGLSSAKSAFVWDINGDEVSYDLSTSRGPRIRNSMWDEYGVVLADVEDIADRRTVTRPGLISECALCHWRSHCRNQVVGMDDLTLISELGRSRRESFPADIATVADLANASLSDLVSNGKSLIPGIGEKSLRKYHARAVLQKKGSPKPYYTNVVVLPESPLELFFDVETDPFRGLCYLHGFVERTGGASDTEKYVAFFADKPDEEAEKDAFAEAWAYVQTNSEAVVYYYSHYERTTWRQLAERHPEVTTPDDVTTLFEEERFVDLYSDIVKSQMIWPTHSLSLKELAAFLGFTWRDADPSGAASIQWFHEWVETGDTSIRNRIHDYNEDDCRAMRVLVDALRSFACTGSGSDLAF